MGVALLCLPVGQFVHSEASALRAYFPAVQFVHACDLTVPRGWNLPEAHISQLEAVFDAAI